MQARYRVTITDHDYHYTTYVAWVDATSKNQAIVKAGALAGGLKAAREQHSTGGLTDPEIRLEPCNLEEYWEHRETAEVQS